MELYTLYYILIPETCHHLGRRGLQNVIVYWLRTSSTSGISAGALWQELHFFILIHKQAVTIKRETCPNCPAAHGRCQQNSEQNMIYKTKRKNPEEVCSKNTFPVLQVQPFRCFRVVYKTLPHILCYGTLYPEYDTSLLDFQVLEHNWYLCFTSERPITAEQQ